MTAPLTPATPSTPAASPAGDATGRPWYRVPAMYLVIGGPLFVVLASLGTAVIAYRGADRPLLERVPAAESTQPMSPALSARNHAATTP